MTQSSLFIFMLIAMISLLLAMIISGYFVFRLLKSNEKNSYDTSTDSLESIREGVKKGNDEYIE